MSDSGFIVAGTSAAMMEASGPWGWILAAAAAASVLHILISRLQNYRADMLLARKHGCALPPELPKRWPLGIDRIREIWKSNADGHLLEFLCSIAKNYDGRNNLCQYFLFGPRAYHILHPANVESFLSTNFKDYGFGCRPAVFAPLLGNGIFTQEGSAWRYSRDLLRKQFVRAKYKHLESSFAEHVDNLISSMPARGVVDLQPLFFSLTLDTSTALLFGRSVYSLRASIDQAAENKLFAESFEIAQGGLAKRFRIAPFHFLYNPPDFRRACRNVHQFVERYIRQRKLGMQLQQANDDFETGESSWFFDQVAAASASEADLRDQLLNVLLAGRDTTACCLSWAFRLLVRHEQVMTRVRDEVSAVMRDNMHLTREHIKDMPFLACVIKESELPSSQRIQNRADRLLPQALRLYPSVPMNNREAIKTTILPTGGGPDGSSRILVRKGELVTFNQYVNSRMKSIYGEDAEAFRPERWETGELSHIGWAYFPFNGGPRQCLGEDFALMEVSYTLVRLLQAFPVIKLPEGDVVEPVGAERQRLTLVLSSADGCRVAVNAAA